MPSEETKGAPGQLGPMGVHEAADEIFRRMDTQQEAESEATADNASLRNSPAPEEAPELPPSEPEDEEPSAEEDDEVREASDELEDESETAEEETEGPLQLADLAKEMDVSVDELMDTIRHQVKVDGKLHDVTLRDLVKGFGLESSLTNKFKRFAEERRSFEAIEAQRKQQWDQQHQLIANHLAISQQLLEQEWASPEMEQLKLDNPADWVVRKQELQERYQSINQAREQAMVAYQAEEDRRYQEHLSREKQRLQEAIPAWGQETHDRVKSVMEGLGFNEQEIGSVADSRFIVAMHRLGELEAENKTLKAKQTKFEEAKKQTSRKLKKLPPKVLKPSKERARQQTSRARRMKAAMDRARKSGSVQDAANALMTRWME